MSRSKKPIVDTLTPRVQSGEMHAWRNQESWTIRSRIAVLREAVEDKESRKVLTPVSMLASTARELIDAWETINGRAYVETETKDEEA